MKIKKCGHPCIGLCGEKCPTLCRICHKEKVTKIFFGNEDEPDARFIQLIDCKHIIDYQAMDYWMESRYGAGTGVGDAESEKNTIQLPECPKCKTQIRRSFRYSKYVKLQQRSIEQVKLRINMVESQETIKDKVKKILNSITNINETEINIFN